VATYRWVATLALALLVIRHAASIEGGTGATTSEIESSLVPMLSKPSLVIDVIRKAADAVQKSKAA
jgi:hypothetical protein